MGDGLVQAFGPRDAILQHLIASQVPSNAQTTTPTVRAAGAV